MRIPNHLEDLARLFPTIEPLDRYIREEYRRFGSMTLDETRELCRHGELYKLYRARERKQRRLAEDRARAARIRGAALSADD